MNHNELRFQNETSVLDRERLHHQPVWSGSGTPV
jgi:hypothetical protein